MKTCIQCGASTEEKFCSNCGQKQDITRLTIKSFFSDFFSRIYGLDGAFPRTVVGLFKNPGTVVLEYIKGIRGKYVGPVGYYFLMFTILLIIINVLGFEVADYFPKTEDISDSIIEETGNKQSEAAKALGREIKEKVYNNIQYISFLLAPFLGLWGSVWFRKSKFNLLESIVFAFFVLGQAIIFNMIGFFVFAATGYKNLIVVNFIEMIYCTTAISLFYTSKISIKSIMRSLAAFILSYLSFILFTIISITILVMVRFLLA